MVKQKNEACHLDSCKLDKIKERAPVSVVIPCYCCSKTIGRALASIVAQTMLPHEVLLIEDSSPDGGKTLEELHYLAASYGEVFEMKIIAMKDNAGAASARNAGWTMATQPYIAFLDSDDAWHPRKIEYQYEYMRAHPDVTLCGHAYHISKDSEEYANLAWSVSAESIEPLRLLLSNPFVTPSVMVKSGITFRFMSGKRYTDDHLLWLEIALAGLSVVRLSAPLALIHKAMYGEGGLSSHMWPMEKSELWNYWHLYDTGRIGLLSTMVLTAFSLAKYVRRLMVMEGRRIGAWARK